MEIQAAAIMCLMYVCVCTVCGPNTEEIAEE